MSTSGKFVLRLDPIEHARLKKEAARRGLSLNEVVKDKIRIRQTSQYDITSITKHWRTSLVGVVLFGSVARGENIEKSDVDLLIVLNNNIPINRKLYSDWDNHILPNLGELYSPQFVHLASDFSSVSGLWLEVAMDGIVIQDDTGVIKKTLVQIKDLIATGRYQRKFSYGQPYWVKNAK